MTTPIETFRQKVPVIMRLLMADFGLTDVQAAALLGNLGHESYGLTAFQERNPTVAGSRGGWGWAQWTGPRRVAFEAYCKRNDLDPKSDKANYGWLFTELSGSEAGAITALKKATDLKSAVRAFENHFERAGVKNYASRETWARRAWDAYREASGSDEVRLIQQKLTALGHDPGPIDGVMGPRTLAAITAALAT
jgi:hypothetical protein